MADRLPAATSTLGSALRWPLRLLPAGTVVPVLAGPARGTRWIVGSGPHSCWLGLNERGQRAALARALAPGDVVFDVGAHVGSYTVLAAKRVGPSGRVVALEPDLRSLPLLRRHLALNDVEAVVTVLAAAAGERRGVARFLATPDRVTSRVDDAGAEEVAVVTLDDTARELGLRPNCIKIDVEGKEAEVLRGAARILEADRPQLFVSVHSDALERECRRHLDALGYAVTAIPGNADQLVAVPR